jgi:outer membrane protein TolC
MKALPAIVCCSLLACSSWLSGCRSAKDYENQADQAAALHIEEGQKKALGRTEAFTIEQPSVMLRRRLLADQLLPALQPAVTSSVPALPDPLVLTLDDTLRIGAAQSREFQDAKENVYRAALDLDLEADAFRNTFSGALGTLFSADNSVDPSVRQITGAGNAGLTRKLKAGATLTSHLAFDLAKLLSSDRDSSFGLTADASIAVPLLRGAGREIATEALTQAERNMVYAIRRFELFKQTFAIRLASDYLSVLQQFQAVQNAASNLTQVQDAYERARQLSDSGRLPGIQVDQARQDVLRAENRLNATKQLYESQLDSLKVTLGLPADARVTLVRDELVKLAFNEGGIITNDVMPITESQALGLALTNRFDLMNVADAVQDAERSMRIARDSLRAGLGLKASGSTRDTSDLEMDEIAGLSLRADRSRYAVGLDFDAPWHRTPERNAYRNSLLELDKAVRDLEETEDRVKLDVRNTLRDLAVARETCRIQTMAVELAQSRVKSTEIYLQAGRAEVRDMLEAQAALVSTQDALTSAIVDRRIAELNLQQSLGVLQVNPEGLWQEYDYAVSQVVSD